MPRRKIVIKRKWYPDPVYSSVAVSRFINNLMKDGKKSKAQKIFYKAMEYINKTTGEDALTIFHTALKNVAPAVEVWPRKLGGATFLVPRATSKERKFSKAVKWLIQAAREKKGKPMYLKLAEELISASKKEGSAYKIKLEVHKQAEANKAFVHLGWWGKKKNK